MNDGGYLGSCCACGVGWQLGPVARCGETIGAGGRLVDAQRSDPKNRATGVVDSAAGGGGQPYSKNTRASKPRIGSGRGRQSDGQTCWRDGKVVALGTVVDPQGYVVTKASLLAREDLLPDRRSVNRWRRPWSERTSITTWHC